MLYDNTKKGECGNSEDVEWIFSGVLQGSVTDFCENGNEHMDLICKGVFLRRWAIISLSRTPLHAVIFTNSEKKILFNGRARKQDKVSRCEQTSD